MRIVAEPVSGEDLKPGDLFSNAGQQYWDSARMSGSIGERVYIRTDNPLPDDAMSERVYRIRIKR